MENNASELGALVPHPPRLSARYSIVQLGLGGVGQALVRQYLELRGRFLGLDYAALGDRSGLLWMEHGWSADDLQGVLDAKARGESLADFAKSLGGKGELTAAGATGLPQIELAPDVAGSYIVVDVTAERSSYATALDARQQGAHLVLCNKWALAEPQAAYDALLSAGSGRMLYETTVGAALPVIAPLDRILVTGDEVLSIEAAISGTMGFVCSEIGNGSSFSAALAEARRLGYTEPDARDDLAGIDARRKALILARKLGRRLDMADVEVESMVPAGLESVSVDEFWARLPEADDYYATLVAEATARGNVLRFLATIDDAGARIGLREVPLTSLPGGLTGTESLFVYKTRRYGEQPLAVRGRGAGAEITASGVLADVLQIAAY